MKRADILIVTVLAASVVASVVGALTYTDERGAGAFLVSWTLREVELDAGALSLPGGGEETITFAVEASNLSRVTIDVQLASSVPAVQPVQLRIEATPPNGTPQSAEAQVAVGEQGASAQVEVRFFETPEAASVNARSPEAALRASLPANATAARGAWTILVSVAGGAPGPLAGSYAIEYAAMGEAIEGSARPDVPEVDQR